LSSEPFVIEWKLDDWEALLRFAPERYQNLLDRLWLILNAEVNRAIVIAKFALVPIKTGNLRDSITIIEENQAELYMIAGPQAEYAVFVEFGTSKMEARPFWRPPIWEAFFRMRELCQQEITAWSEGR
jgi:HK97 gp10 family phage protein